MKKYEKNMRSFEQTITMLKKKKKTLTIIKRKKINLLKKLQTNNYYEIPHKK
jgi:hypothetical protein